MSDGCDHNEADITPYLEDAWMDTNEHLSVPASCHACGEFLTMSFSLDKIESARRDDDE